MLACNPWRQNLLLADAYGHGRVFLAGDAVHLVVPTGGLGMNTGVGDAIDLSWKLHATLQGWGGPNLLRSYEIERRQVGDRNVEPLGDPASVNDAARHGHRHRNRRAEKDGAAQIRSQQLRRTSRRRMRRHQGVRDREGRGHGHAIVEQRALRFSRQAPD